MGSLVLWIEGRKSTPCHEVKVERSPLTVEPPAFILNQCVPDDILCIQVLTPFETLAGPFAIGPYRPEVVLHHAGGELTVKVEHVHELVHASNGGGGEVPTPFIVLPGKGGKQKPAGGDVPIPFFKSSLPKGAAKPKAGEPVDRAMGIGETFEDAFNDAAAAILSGRGRDYPDQLRAVKVVESGAMWGGLIGYFGQRYVIAELAK